MRSYFLTTFLWAAIILVGCKGESNTKVDEQAINTEEIAEETASALLTDTQWKNLKQVTFNRDANKIIASWSEFRDVDTYLKDAKNINRSSLAPYLEELETKYDEMMEVKFPDKFDVPQIKSRWIVFKTHLLKLKDKASDSRYKDEELQEGLLLILGTFNSIKTQCNEISSASFENDKRIIETSKN